MATAPKKTIPAAGRKVTEKDNDALLLQARETIASLGATMRQSLTDKASAELAGKQTKAESMKAFALNAEAGLITSANFAEWYLLWKFEDGVMTGTAIAIAAEKSRFSRVVEKAIAAKDSDRKMSTVCADIIALVPKAREANKKDKKNNPMPLQADLAIYKASGLSDLSLDNVKTNAVFAPATERKTGAAATATVDPIDAIVAGVNDLLKAAPVQWRSKLREAAAMLGSYKDAIDLAAEQAAEAEQEAA